ncbi:tail fiber domain-containing protein [Calothrix membranacea FACHB-236]|nr:tail fiber domain-containing protein [Calothrix membranacea FACHB-236]
MDFNPKNLSKAESLIEDLSDEQLAECIGGCDIQVTTGDHDVAQVPLYELPLLGESNIKITFLGIYYDPNGSQRYRSDRNVKEAVVEADVHSILQGIANLPITSWQYKDQGEKIRHIGPMAQDFAATFKVGESDRTINVVDANGVALAAIQALYQVIQKQDSQINELQAQVLELKQQIIQ